MVIEVTGPHTNPVLSWRRREVGQCSQDGMMEDDPYARNAQLEAENAVLSAERDEAREHASGHAA
jgi:hypothetical protein